MVNGDGRQRLCVDSAALTGRAIPRYCPASLQTIQEKVTTSPFHHRQDFHNKKKIKRILDGTGASFSLPSQKSNDGSLRRCYA